MTGVVSCAYILKFYIKLNYILILVLFKKNGNIFKVEMQKRYLLFAICLEIIL